MAGVCSPYVSTALGSILRNVRVGERRLLVAGKISRRSKLVGALLWTDEDDAVGSRGRLKEVRLSGGPRDGPVRRPDPAVAPSSGEEEPGFGISTERLHSHLMGVVQKVVTSSLTSSAPFPLVCGRQAAILSTATPRVQRSEDASRRRVLVSRFPRHTQLCKA